MLYNVLVGFVFAQLHYTTKKAASFLFLDAAFSFVFLQPHSVLFVVIFVVEFFNVVFDLAFVAFGK